MPSAPIPFYPVLGPRQALGARHGALPGALGAPGAVRLRFARTGLRLIAATLDPGCRVLLPDLLCASAIEPFAAAGLRIDRYPVGPALEADPSAVSEGLRTRTRAVVVVSYFGLPQPFAELRALCEENDALLIDDAAHSLLSELDGRPYGTLGHVGVVSARKSLPVPDGAAAIGAHALPDDLPDANGDGALRYLARTLARQADRVTGADLLGRRARRRSGLLPEGDGPRVPEATGWSRLTGRILVRVDPEAERRLRRRVFAAWSPLVTGHGASPVSAPDLAAGVGPSGYPLRVDDEALFARRMQELRVEWIRWPDRPETCATHPRGVAVLPTHTPPAG